MAGSSKGKALRHGPIGPDCRHLCIDMRRLFAEDTPWRTRWMERVAPRASLFVARAPASTIFTRFIPPLRPEETHGNWRRYYERWADITQERMDRDKLALIPELAEFVPPALVLDKAVYSPWYGTCLHGRLQAEGVRSLIVSGGETDVCVLSAVLGAIDLGYRVIVATDALCSSSDESHDALVMLYENRFQEQIEAVGSDIILDAWDP